MEFGDNKMLYLRDTWRESNMICDVTPLNPSSNGVWPAQKLPDPIVNIDFWSSPFPHIHLIFITISFLWQFLHFFLQRLGMIRFTSQMLVSYPKSL